MAKLWSVWSVSIQEKRVVCHALGVPGGELLFLLLVLPGGGRGEGDAGLPRPFACLSLVPAAVVLSNPKFRLVPDSSPQLTTSWMDQPRSSLHSELLGCSPATLSALVCLSLSWLLVCLSLSCFSPWLWGSEDGDAIGAECNLYNKCSFCVGRTSAKTTAQTAPAPSTDSK